MLQKQETYTISEFLLRTEPKESVKPIEENIHFFLQTYLREVKTRKTETKKEIQNACS